MDDLKTKTESFNLMYEKFVTACDSAEEAKKWDRENDGEMEAYYFNDLSCVIIRLMSSDGSFSEEEADDMNELFGFTYTADELKELYRVQSEDIDSLLEEIPADIRKLEAIDPGIAQLFSSLLLTACEIISGSDRVIDDDEQKLIDGLKAKLA